VDQRIVPFVGHRRQLNLACTLQHEQQAPADHIAQSSVGLPPVPGFTQPLRQRPPTGSTVGCNQAPDESYLFNRDYASAILPSAVHDNRSVEEIFLERKCFFSLLSATLGRPWFPGYPLRTVTAPDEPGAFGPPPCRLATRRIYPSI